ncbi:glycosyl transferase [Agarivorans sp. OAG1]|uniref:Glycosyltransferase n=1 Tax=Agarivorans albus MKT 106 TaxID=1331007 RepID=R9PT88_AGAAL|nr:MULTISPECIES: glycosyl transferase [Agarivorans]BEU02651.1 glycosyl transferase [Agarivorans sp. OAG1]GAD01996.1 glycosyltransferase [Agarivorans albus MKT 106]
MADFYQNGIVTTLHNLTDRPLEELEQELIAFSKVRPMSLVLPSLFSELERPALATIVEELAKVPYLSEIIIGLDCATEEQFAYAKEYFSGLPQHVRILWNDGPRLRALDAQLAEHNLAPKEPGKGRNVWYCFGYALASGKSKAVGLHDCDIITYDRSMLARLMYPVANPLFNYEFCKGFYARHADGKLNGRVARLLVTPLLKALKKIEGYDDYLEYLDSFRYSLAGEFSMQSDVLNDLRIPSDWGLEIGVLSEIYRNHSTNRICQVDIADVYDHKHQDLSLDNLDAGLAKMATDISKAVIRKLATQGHTFSPGKLRTLKATYYRMALDFIENYHADALINGLTLDRHSEEDAVELFSKAVMQAGETFLENPSATPFIPSWNRVQSAAPDFLERLYEAVEADNC